MLFGILKMILESTNYIVINVVAYSVTLTHKNM